MLLWHRAMTVGQGTVSAPAVAGPGFHQSTVVHVRPGASIRKRHRHVIVARTSSTGVAALVTQPETSPATAQSGAQAAQPAHGTPVPPHKPKPGPAAPPAPDPEADTHAGTDSHIAADHAEPSAHHADGSDHGSRRSGCLARRRLDRSAAEATRHRPSDYHARQGERW